jgi:methylated-DNA-[protein]-cysteine S-methyltransferase
MSHIAAGETWLIFPSALGHFGLCAVGGRVKRVTFGHATARLAARAVGCPPASRAPRNRVGGWQQSLVHRLQAYAAGVPMDFRDLQLDLGQLTDFQRSVARHCRHIPYGCTRTYGELARLAGAPRAARAVGNCMAANLLPLIVPCHRVIPASGGYGSYSAPGGARLKRRLLALEARGLAKR